MLYNKDDKRYVDMCKIFDEEFPKEDRDDNKLYRYVYLVFYMLACKNNFTFKRFEDYDSFAQFAATTIYLRFLNKLKKGEKVKSLLNYAKSTIKFLKIMWQNREFCEVLDPKLGIDTDNLQRNMREYVQADYNQGREIDIEESLSSISEVVSEVVNESQYKNDKVILQRLKISVLLSLLNSITLPKHILKQIRGRKKYLTDDEVIESLEVERDNCIILWKLKPDMKNYVKLLVNKVRQTIGKDINETSQAYELPDDVIDSIIASAYAETLMIPENEGEYD